MTAGGKGKSRAMRTTKSLYQTHELLWFYHGRESLQCACAVNYMWRSNAMQLQMRGLWNITQNVHGRTMAALRTEHNTKGPSRTCHLRSADYYCATITRVGTILMTFAFLSCTWTGLTVITHNHAKIVTCTAFPENPLVNKKQRESEWDWNKAKKTFT